MRFGSVPIDQAIGGVVAHAVRQGEFVLKKGVIVGPEQVAQMRRHGVSDVVVAMMEEGDLGEDEAARRIAEAAAGAFVEVEAPATGRANLFSTASGVLLVDRARIDAANSIDEAITLATLPPYRKVTAGEMIGTVKIIPFAVAGALASLAMDAARAAIRVAPFRGRKVGMISTVLPGLKASVLDKTKAVLADRLRALDASTIHAEMRVAHDVSALADALAAMCDAPGELVVVFGASAITDRRDVIPAALERAGGRIEHLGMPVDPGNLLLIGELRGVPVLGAPGCARSPRENGFDWVLERLCADVPVRRADIQAMGPGGLLMEIVTRPQPRAAGGRAAGPQVAAVVLAAGRSTRMGANKLLAHIDGRPVVRHVVEAALASRASPVSVVLGHEAEMVRQALAGLDVTFVDNPDYALGMSTSLRRGIAAVPGSAPAALILLGDMPRTKASSIDRIIEAQQAAPAAKAVVPVAGGRRANPVLISRALFEAVGSLQGDVGAKPLLEAAGADVVEIGIDDAGLLLDVDTPEALASARGETDAG